MNCCCKDRTSLNMKIKKGESLGFVFNLKQNNEVMDLTGASILFQVREELADNGVYVINKTIAEGSSLDTTGQIINPEQGQFVIKITNTDTENLTTLKPYFCAIYVEIDGNIRCISANSNEVALLTVLNP